MKPKLWLFVLFAVTICHAHAQVTWDKEPTSFLDIKFGVPLEQSVSPCPENVAHPTGECFTKSVSDSSEFAVQNHPSGQTVFVYEVDGNVAAVKSQFETSQADQISGSMIEKFGAPTARHSSTMQNPIGAIFNVAVLEWKGQNVSIRFESRATSTHEGMLVAYTPPFLKLLKEGAATVKTH